MPGAEMAAFDFAAAEQTLRDTYATASGDDGAEGAADAVEIRDELDVLSYAMYPAVFDEWMAHRREYGDAVAAVPTRSISPFRRRVADLTARWVDGDFVFLL